MAYFAYARKRHKKVLITHITYLYYKLQKNQ